MRKGKVYGVEFTGNYTHGGFSTYANVAVSRRKARIGIRRSSCSVRRIWLTCRTIGLLSITTSA